MTPEEFISKYSLLVVGVLITIVGYLFGVNKFFINRLVREFDEDMDALKEHARSISKYVDSIRSDTLDFKEKISESQEQIKSDLGEISAKINQTEMVLNSHRDSTKKSIRSIVKILNEHNLLVSEEKNSNN